MADATADVERTRPIQRELTRRVALVLHREERRRQERCFALAAVWMAAQDPAAETVPAVQIDRVRIVTEGHGGTPGIQRPKLLLRVEVTGPQVVHTRDLQ